MYPSVADSYPNKKSVYPGIVLDIVMEDDQFAWIKDKVVTQGIGLFIYS